MRFNGSKLEPPKPLTVVFPRPGADDVVFKVRPILDFEEFDKACPVPKPPMITRPNKKPEPNEKDEGYRKEVVEHYDRQRGWTYLKALSATQGLEFETTTLADPKTWSHVKFVEEMKADGFTVMEIAYLIRTIDRANVMDEKHMDEVRDRFLQKEAESRS